MVLYLVFYLILFTLKLSEYIFFLFPLVTYIVSWLMKLLQTNIFVALVVTIIGVTLLELGVYEMNFLIGITEMNFTSFPEY